jgi:pilus assembly protein FimV
MPPRATALILACALSAVAHEVQALGFGRLNSTAVLGQPLNLPVPLRLDAGERLEPECVQAAVTAGESL